MSDNCLSRCWRRFYQSICSTLQRWCICCCCCCCCRRNPNILERKLLRECSAVSDSYRVFNLLTRLPCVDVNCQSSTSSEDTPLLLATYADNYRKVRTLLRRGADSQRPNRSGLTPLRLALSRRQHDLLHLMCNVHHTDMDAYRQLAWTGWDTALHQACREGNAPGLGILLSSGANPDLLSADASPQGGHLTCLDLAVMRRDGAIVRELLRYNCRPVFQTISTPLRTRYSGRVWNVLETSPAIVDMLLQAGCPLCRYWWLQQRLRSPADSPLRAKVQEVPSLEVQCRAVVREVLNRRGEWGKGGAVRQQVREVLRYYRGKGVVVGRSVVQVQDFLLLWELEGNVSVGDAVDTGRYRRQQEFRL